MSLLNILIAVLGISAVVAGTTGVLIPHLLTESQLERFSQASEITDPELRDEEQSSLMSEWSLGVKIMFNLLVTSLVLAFITSAFLIGYIISSLL